MTIYVLYHADSDGRFAGWCAQHYLRKGNKPSQNVSLHEVQYNKPLPFKLEDLTKDDQVYILDFSYSRDICIDIRSRVEKLVILDHHESAKHELECLPYAHFDMTKSGALLAWEYFFPGTEAPWVCRLVNDRDLWKFEHGDKTRALEAYLRINAIKSNWEKWDNLVFDELHTALCIKEGMAYIKYERETIANFVRNPSNVKTIKVNIDGEVYSCAVYEGMGILHSELAEYIYTNCNIDFTMEWRIKDLDTLVFSLRSKKINVSKLAKSLGGGGHKAAAGFSMSLEKGFKFVNDIYHAAANPDPFQETAVSFLTTI